MDKYTLSAWLFWPFWPLVCDVLYKSSYFCFVIVNVSVSWILSSHNLTRQLLLTGFTQFWLAESLIRTLTFDQCHYHSCLLSHCHIWSNFSWYLFLSSLVSGLRLVLCSITLILLFTAIRLTWFHHTILTYLAITPTNVVPLSLQFLRFSINFLQMSVSSWMTSLNVSSSQSLAVTNLTWSSINLA